MTQSQGLSLRDLGTLLLEAQGLSFRARDSHLEPGTLLKLQSQNSHSEPETLNQSYTVAHVGQNNQEYRLKYWVTCSSFHSFTRTQSFACSALLPLFKRSALLTRWLALLLRSLPRSLLSLPCSLESEGYLFCVFFYSGPQ